MFFIYPTPQYPRKPLEYVFKSIYLLANLLHVTSLVVLISDFYTRLSNSMPDYYRHTNLVISDSITLVMQDCVYNGTMHLGNVRGGVQVTIGNIGYGLMTTAQYITGLFVLEFLLLVNNLVTALNYSKGNRHLRIFGVHVPLYHITVMMTQVYSVAICVLMWSFDGNRRFFQSALKYCAAEMRRENYQQLLSTEFDDYTIFSTAVYWPFAATCVSEIIYFVAVVILCWFSEDEATILLSEADAPWESRGVMCTTCKPLLKLHTAQRNAIIEDARNAIKEGQKVRIVRSYQLMTEEDFEALVQAMREQVAKALKEKQFEKLKEHFGDHESQIDNMGFAWRENMMAPQPMEDEEGVLGSGQDGGAAADQFFDVPFDDYFTDNEMNENAREQMNDADFDGGGAGDVVYNDDPLQFDQAFDGGGVDGYGEGGAYGFDADDAVGTQDAWSPQEGDYDAVGGGVAGGDGEMYDPEQPSRVTHSHHRRRHRHSRAREERGWRDGEEGEYYGGEPDPRLPASAHRGYDDGGGLDSGGNFGDAATYYDANEDMMYGGTGSGSRGDYNTRGRGGRDRAGNGTGVRSSQRRRSNRGRQAGVEQDVEEADELSDDFGY